MPSAVIDGRDNVLLKALRGGGNEALDVKVRQHCKWRLEQPCVLQWLEGLHYAQRRRLWWRW